MRAMRLVFATAVALTGLTFLASSGCSEKSPPTPPPSYADLPDLHSAGLKSIWQRQVRLESGESIRKVWRVGDSLYFATSIGRMTRIEAASGVVAWDIGFGPENRELYRPIELKPESGPPTEVVICSRGSAFVLDKHSGIEKRFNNLGISVTTDPAIVGNTLCVGRAGAYLGMYLDLLSGVRWSYITPGEFFVSSPVVVEGNLIVASQHGRLARVSGESGDWEWKDRKANGDVVAPLVADARAVYVPSLDQRVYAFGVATGAELWETQLEGVLDQPASLGTGVIMIPSSGRGLFGLTRQTGEKLWYAPGITAVGTVLDDKAWTMDSAGNLVALKLATGEILSTTHVPEMGFIVRNNTQDDSIVIVNRGGQVGSYTAK